MEDIVKKLHDIYCQLDEIAYDPLRSEEIDPCLRDSFCALTMHAFSVYKLFEEF